MKSKNTLPTNSNIVVVNDFDYTQGGASKVAIDTANVLVENYDNINVYFFSSVHSDKSNLDERVIKVCCNQKESLREKNKIKGIINGIYNFKAKKEFKRLLKSLDKQKTIVHVHGWTKALSSSIFDIAFKMEFKVVLTMHDYFTACPNGGYFNYKQNEICHLNPLSMKCIKCNCDSRSYGFKLYRIIRQFVQNKVVRLNDKLTDVISISDFSEKIIIKTLNPGIKIHRVYNPIDLDKNPEKMNYRKNKYFLYVGRISKEKGVDIFCEAISELNLHGIVVGDGEERKSLEEKYPTIEFVGWKDSKEVKEYMKGAKALVFPSRWYEGAPLTPLEAMQFNIPFITSDCNASVDYLNKDQQVLVITKNNDLKNILKKLEAGKLEIHFNDDLFLKFTKYNFNIMKVYKNMLGEENDEKKIRIK